MRYVELDDAYLMGFFFGSGSDFPGRLAVVLPCYLTAFGNRFHTIICSVKCGNVEPEIGNHYIDNKSLPTMSYF